MDTIIKKLIPVFLTIIFLYSCNSNRVNNHETSEHSLNAEQIQDSLKTIVQIVFKNSETLNLEKALSPFLATDEFQFISNGQKFSFNDLKKIETEYFSTLKQQSFNFTDQNFNVINQDNAIATLIGTLTAVQKDGLIQKSNIAETIIFKKINGAWKIVGGHESYIADTSK